MNRLLRKLKEFGLIFSVNLQGEDDTITICHSLKEADNPVIMFDYTHNQQINQVKISNENEDMFIGARCRCDFDEMKSALASGAHFITTPMKDEQVIKKCLSNGFDLIGEVHSESDINRVIKYGMEAVVINCASELWQDLIEYSVSQPGLSVFLRGEKHILPFEQWGNHKQIIALIIEQPLYSRSKEMIYSETQSLINRLLGVKFISLTLNADSEKLDEGKVFASLSAIPLNIGNERDLLIIGVGDMDRMIAHLKWKNIFMDPLSAKMKGSEILETELYSTFLGWNVKLINCRTVFSAD